MAWEHLTIYSQLFFFIYLKRYLLIYFFLIYNISCRFKEKYLFIFVSITLIKHAIITQTYPRINLAAQKAKH